MDYSHYSNALHDNCIKKTLQNKLRNKIVRLKSVPCVVGLVPQTSQL